MLTRSSGILMPIFSLPSDHGIGTLGEEAIKFVDFLKSASQSYWQILPIGPTGFGDSPYQCLSSFAGNPYFIDLDILKKEGLLEEGDLENAESAQRVDYEHLYHTRMPLLTKAARAGIKKDGAAAKVFARDNADWIGDYALYTALKEHFGMKPWYEWDEEIRRRDPAALDKKRQALKDRIDEIIYIQFLFFKQWEALKSYAHENGVKIIGDMPIYVAYDSADVWANARFFKLNEDCSPRCVAGVPPDAFSADGQLWGNPIYDWDKLKEDGYGFWIRRIGAAARAYDVIRIDHFRGLESYWEIPAGSVTAKSGRWVKGPGIDFVRMITSWFYGTDFIAEDLGILTPEVRKLLADSGLPGMKVLEFAFEPEEGGSAYLPHKYSENAVCYIGTHDNDTLNGWYKNGKKREISFAKEYLAAGDDFADSIIRAGMRSKANLFIVQMQDWLSLDSKARINTPGTALGNWRWRMEKGAATKTLAKKIKTMTETYSR
ncbi:MAG: 4-alpha-glucanotransferase [Clostridia bacterium]|nr:4-alpha-glucanotransferase [Clostridia bacterium]